jgi:electron transfer flavoprotein alpha subunit
MSATLVVAELARGAPTRASLELLGLARALAAPAAGKVSALLMRADQETARKLIAHGADRVLMTGEPAAEQDTGETWLACAEQAVAATASGLVLAAHTSRGADLAPRLGFRLRSAAVTGCVAIERVGGTLQFTRACYGGNARETVTFRTLPAVATVRAGNYDVLPADAARQGEIVTLPADRPASRLRVIARRTDGAARARLEDARVVVAGGRGLHGPEGFRVLEDLAIALGGVVGASRVPCDLGWCPHSMQIGLTGKTVTPDLYIAVGISGAGHHMAGCGGARNIVAINTDPEAAIFREARFGVVGDFGRVVPALAAAVRAVQLGEATLTDKM